MGQKVMALGLPRRSLMWVAMALLLVVGFVFSSGQAEARTVFSFDGERNFQVRPSTVRVGIDLTLSMPNGWQGWGGSSTTAEVTARWICKYSPEWGCPGYETREGSGLISLGGRQRCGRDLLYRNMTTVWNDGEAPFGRDEFDVRFIDCKIKFGEGDSSRLSAIGSMRPKSFSVGFFERYRTVKWSRWTGPTATAKARQILSQSCDPTCKVRRRAVRIVLSNPGRCGGSDTLSYRQMRVYVGKRVVSREKLCTGAPI